MRIFGPRSLRVHILTMFLLILITTFTVSLWYIYQENKTVAISVTSNRMMQVNSKVIEHVRFLFKKISDLSELELFLITDENGVSPENKDLVAFMHHGIEIVPEMTVLFIANHEEQLLAVFNLIPGIKYKYINKNVAPENAKFVLQFVNKGHETWIYKDENWKSIGQPISEIYPYQIKDLPWYKGAADTKKPFWTPIGELLFTGKAGLSLGNPKLNDNDELIAVAGGQIELSYLSYFLDQQEVSKNTQIAILNDEGDVLAASGLLQDKAQNTDLIPVDFYNPILAAAYAEYNKSKITPFLLDIQGIEYVVSANAFNYIPKQHWLTITVAPTSDFLNAVDKMQTHLYIMLSIILVAATLLVAYFAKRIARPVTLVAKEIDAVTHLEISEAHNLHNPIKEINTMLNSLEAMKAALKSFLCYVPKQVVQKLLQQKKEIQLGTEAHELTIFFSDIQDFTAISEAYTTELVMGQLNQYFEKFSSIILKNYGTIDKYIGDAVMAFWGAPDPIQDAPFYACRSALLCQRELSKMNQSWNESSKPQFLTRIGIHIGFVNVGNIGTSERMNYTAIGDPVNLASRLEETNKVYHTKIIISEKVKNSIGMKFLVRPLDIVTVKGKKEKTKIYELVGQFDASEPELVPTKEQVEFCEAFSIAFETYLKGDKESALKLFMKIEETAPEDIATKLAIERCKNA